MTKKFYYLIKVEDDEMDSKCHQFKINVSRKGEPVSFDMIEVIDDDQHDFNPCIFF